MIKKVFFGLMKSAVKMGIDSINSIDRCRWTSGVNGVDLNVNKKKILKIHSNLIKVLCFFRYFWHKNLIQVFMPKEPQKLKILKNKKVLND